MTDKNYSRTINTSASAQQVYEALTTGFEKWWTKSDNVFSHVGDKIKFTFPPKRGYWSFEAKKLEPFKLVEMECIEALHIHEGKPDAIREEWLGTTVIWKIKANEGQTELSLVHEGLKPSLICYEICAEGWDYFFVHSLSAYLNKGVGTPHTE